MFYVSYYLYPEVYIYKIWLVVVFFEVKIYRLIFQIYRKRKICYLLCENKSNEYPTFPIRPLSTFTSPLSLVKLESLGNLWYL